LEAYKDSLAGSNVKVQVLEGLEHNQVFDNIDRVFLTMLAFTDE